MVPSIPGSGAFWVRRTLWQRAYLSPFFLEQQSSTAFKGGDGSCWAAVFSGGCTLWQLVCPCPWCLQRKHWKHASSLTHGRHLSCVNGWGACCRPVA